MQLTVSTWDDRIVSVELAPDDPLDNLRAILEVETGLPSAQQSLLHNGRELSDSQSLGQQQVQPGDLIMLMKRPLAAPRGGGGAGAGVPADAAAGSSGQQQQNPMALQPDGSAVNPDLMLQLLRSSPQQLDQLPPPLADAVRAGDVNNMQDQLRQLRRKAREAQDEEERFMRLAEEDPFNPEVQRRLEDAIRQKNVNENFEQALEHNPEAFGSVCMLYVNMEVNGVPVKAFIDSGAQITIMGKSFAERCGVLRLMDTRFQGVAVGVGSAKMLGRIHMAPLKAGNHFFPVSITVLDQDGMEFLFGLDNLKRHQCMIDLKANVLRFGTTDTALPFLPEHECPRKIGGRDEEMLESPRTDAGLPGSTQQQHTQPQGQQARGMPGQAAGATAPPAPAAAPTAAGPAAGASGGAEFEAKVQQLQGLGFPRDHCEAALRQAGGNVDLAASVLFGGF